MTPAMRFLFLLSVLATICAPANLHAQDVDIEFGYDNANSPTVIMVDPTGFSTITGDGISLADSRFRERDPFNPGEFSADQPGFATNTGQGLIVNSGNGIMINALDASVDSAFGVGYVNFYNPATDTLEATGRLAFRDNTAGTPDLVLNGSAIESGVTPQFIELADSGGEVHDHIVWDLLDDNTAPFGAYGILVQLQSDFTFDGTIEVSSDPFWVVFNHGMSSADFQNLALPSFGVGQVVPTVLLGDVNRDGVVNFLDIAPFIAVLSGNGFQAEADCDENGVVNFLDIAAFIAILSGV